MTVKPGPTTPKPFYLRHNLYEKPTEQDKIEYIKYCINFYQKRGIELSKQEPLIFKKKWKKAIIEIGKTIEDLEYDLLKLTNPEIISEVDDFVKN